MSDASVADPDTRFLINAYRDWVEGEGVPLIEDFAVDLRTAPVAPWPRLGVNGAVVNVAGRGDFLDLWLLDLPPGQALVPQHHLFEAVAYVISGRGSTTIETRDCSHSFEWGPKSMFALPLNARYQLFNASGREPARIALTTAFPIMMNLLHNADFIFDVDFEFAERLRGPAGHFRGEGRHLSDLHADLTHNFWETNFVPDLGVFAELRPLERRGTASNGIQFMLADGVLHAHMSEIAVGRYKKAHRHMGGTHIYPVTGAGYSLLWYEGDTTRHRVDWCHGVVYSPPDNMYHQHFNVSGEPARYFAVKMGNYRYPVTARMNSQFAASSEQIRERKTQIEYEDEDPAIRELYLSELAKVSIAPKLT
ncbi:hypothetical protein GCM10023322_76580 [Rugosimonospora acidiphila]|uniref:Cupin domain-containing protein n=1 Tax=Rugosimonospora acidiphila TaxID=556531 RepID=A0ABP9SQ57_9ACTN